MHLLERRRQRTFFLIEIWTYFLCCQNRNNNFIWICIEMFEGVLQGNLVNYFLIHERREWKKRASWSSSSSSHEKKSNNFLQDVTNQNKNIRFWDTNTTEHNNVMRGANSSGPLKLAFMSIFQTFCNTIASLIVEL